MEFFISTRHQHKPPLWQRPLIVGKIAFFWVWQRRIIQAQGLWLQSTIFCSRKMLWSPRVFFYCFQFARLFLSSSWPMVNTGFYRESPSDTQCSRRGHGKFMGIQLRNPQGRPLITVGWCLALNISRLARGQGLLSCRMSGCPKQWVDFV